MYSFHVISDHVNQIVIVDLTLSDGVHGSWWLGNDSFLNDLISAVHLKSYNDWV